MRLPAARTASLLVALWLLLPSVVRSANDRVNREDVERLRQATAEYPDDADLSWALVKALARRGDHQAAASRLAAHLKRWPTHRPSAERWLGELLLQSGRASEALDHLDAYLGRQPEDGIAHFYRGLALRRLGRRSEAAAALVRARALEPELGAEALVLQAVDEIAEGQAETGQRLLEEARSIDPTSEIAREAGRALPPPPPPAPFPLALSAYGGIERDSNVTLDSGLPLAGFPEQQQDVRAVWGAGVDWNAWQRGRLGVTVGYRYGESGHRELDAYDLRSHVAFASTLVQLGEGAVLRLDTRFSALELDHAGYLYAQTVQPNVFVQVGPGGGVLRGWGQFEYNDYRDEPLLTSLERDGIEFGGGLEHILPWKAWSRGRKDWGADSHEAWVALALGFERTDTEAERDIFQLGGAYDHDRWEGRLRLHLPLPWKFEASPVFSIARERYAHRNVIDFLTDDGIGTSSPDARRDTVLEGGFALVRPVSQHVRIEVSWRGTRRVSNVDLYDYERHVVGLYVRATTR